MTQPQDKKKKKEEKKYYYKPDGPLVLSDTLKKRLLNLVSHGLPYKVCAEGAGISESTLYKWLNQGKEDEKTNNYTECYDFLVEFRLAESNKIFTLWDKINADKNWQSKAWMLSRRWSKHFGENVGDIEALEAKLEEFKKALNAITTQMLNQQEHKTIAEKVEDEYYKDA
jgi:hypothetical protein